MRTVNAAIFTTLFLSFVATYFFSLFAAISKAFNAAIRTANLSTYLSALSATVL